MEGIVINEKVQANLLSTINQRIERISNAERITKAELSALSRELLEYITLNGSPDIDAVNRTVAVLTPMNKQTAVLFFKSFIPHKEEEGLFKGKLKGEKKLTEFYDSAKAFLSNPDNDIWSWAKDNVQLEQKPKDYFDKITKLVQRALSDENEGLNEQDIIAAILKAGVSAESIIGMMEEQDNEQLAA